MQQGHRPTCAPSGSCLYYLDEVQSDSTDLGNRFNSPTSMSCVRSFRSIKSIPSLDQLGLSLGDSIAKHSRRISVVRHDITLLEVDVIVNAANARLAGGGGVDGAIHNAAGPRLLDACRELDGCSTGSAKITPGFNLPSRYVIHAVGPVYQANKDNEALLRGCYRTALDLAKHHECRTIAFSCISTGVYGYPKVEATHIALDEVCTWLDSNDTVDRVIFCCFSQGDENIYWDQCRQS